jgi:methylated-DNA-protein-cysteine methyltransferase-like protein
MNPPVQNEEEPFFVKVFEVTMRIPSGRVTTYGSIARCIGSPGASRMVGWALNNCHSADSFIPAHRVVNRIGMLTGKHHFRYPGLMQELLESEGIIVENDQIVNFEAHFWDPCDNLI